MGRVKKARATKSTAPLIGGKPLVNSLADIFASGFQQDSITSLLPTLTANIYAPITLNYISLMFMYKTHGLLQTAIDQPVLDALRGGLELQSKELSAENLKDLEDFIEEKSLLTALRDATIWARLFGGGALILNHSVSDPEAPLDMKELASGEFEMYDACRWELGAEYRFAEKYHFYDQTIHQSRVLTIGGKRAPFQIRRQLAGWGMSEFERMLEDFNVYLRTRNVLYEILDEAKVDIYKLDGLRDQLATDSGTQLTKQRISLMNQMKNFQNALMLDKNDDYEQKQMTFSGISDVMAQNRMGLSSALRIPQNKLFGISATGFASGEDDIENYNALVESEIREPIKPYIRQLLKMASYAVFGDEYDISFKFKNLRVMSAKDEETVRDQKHKRAMDLFDRYLISSKEAGEIEQKEGLIAVEIAAASGDLEDHPQPPAMPSFGLQDASEKGSAGEGKNAPKKEQGEQP